MLAGSKSQALQCTAVTPCSISGLDCPTANRERNGIGNKFQNMRFWFLHNGYRLRKVTLMSWWMLIRSQRCSVRRRCTRYQLSFQRPCVLRTRADSELEYGNLFLELVNPTPTTGVPMPNVWLSWSPETVMPLTKQADMMFANFQPNNIHWWLCCCYLCENLM